MTLLGLTLFAMPFTAVLGGTLVLASAGFLLVGLCGLLGRTPLVFPARRMILLILPCFLPGLTVPLLYLAGRRLHPAGASPPLVFFLPIAIFLAVLLLVLKVLRGYTILGAGDRALADGLRQALERLGLPYEESLGRMRLPTRNADLSLHVQPGTGSAQLRMEPEDRPLLDQIAGALRAALAAPGAPGQRLVFGVFTGVGLLMLAVAALVTVGLR